MGKSTLVGVCRGLGTRDRKQGTAETKAHDKTVPRTQRGLQGGWSLFSGAFYTIAVRPGKSPHLSSVPYGYVARGVKMRGTFCFLG